MLKEVLFDMETDGLVGSYTKMHCTALQSPDWKDPILFTDEEELTDWGEKNTDSNTLWIAHNACGFDYWALNDLTGLYVPKENIRDTHVLSRLVNYGKYRTHSLDEIGTHLGMPKTEYDGGWETYTPTMGEYCKDDVRVLARIWGQYRRLPSTWDASIKVEHEMGFILARQQMDGFRFNTHNANELLVSVLDEMAVLEDNMAEEWPPELVVDRTIQWREKADGTPYATCLKAMDTAPKWERKGDELVLYRYKKFNPGSPKDRVDKLWDAGWKPYDKTIGHIKYERDKRSASWRR